MSSRSPGRPRDPRADRAILEAALRLLAEQGYARMSIDAVAAAAGVGKPTIYRRFASKADLATAALASVIDDAPPPDAALDVEAGLTAALEALARRLRAPHSMGLVGTLLVEEEETPELMALFRRRVWAARAGQLRGVLERARARGEVRADVDIEATVVLLIGALYGAHVGQGRIPRGWPARAVRAALRGLR
jgi:AcrR family transcriptional regulator